RAHGPLAPDRTVYLLRQMCRALAEAHAAGLIHRDIKPGNIFVTERGGERDVIKLPDFGLLRLQGTKDATAPFVYPKEALPPAASSDASSSSDDKRSLTAAGSILGTP